MVPIERARLNLRNCEGLRGNGALCEEWGDPDVRAWRLMRLLLTPQYACAVKKRTTNDPNAVKEQLEKVTEVRGRQVLTRVESIDILHVYYSVIDIAHETAAKSGRTVPIKPTRRLRDCWDGELRREQLLSIGRLLRRATLQRWGQTAIGATGGARRRVSRTPRR
eukprot:IDg564t1